MTMERRSRDLRSVPPGEADSPATGPAVPEPPRLLTCRQAGEYTGLGERYMRRLIDEERITFVRIGALVRFERDVLDAFIALHRVPAKRIPPATG